MEIITVSHLRQEIRKTIGEDLAGEGFKFDTKTIWAKRKNGKNGSTRVFVDCYDYKPSRVEFNLLFEFLILDLNEETAKFYQYVNKEYSGRISFMLCTGDFDPKTKFLERKYRTSSTHIVTDSKSLQRGIEDCRKVLNEEIIPALPCFSELDKFQDYILSNCNEAIRLPIFIPALIAVKLRGLDALNKLIVYLWEAMNMDDKDNDNYEKKTVLEVLRFANSGHCTGNVSY